MYFCLFSVGIALSGHLPKLLEEDYDAATRQENLNMVKMTCYLLCQFMEVLEAEETKPSTTQVKAKVSRNIQHGY